MLTFVTVWVLTVFHSTYNYDAKTQTSYQLTYATRDICIKQGDQINKKSGDNYTCNFQQIPMYAPKEK
jgi:hypothetical protein